MKHQVLLKTPAAPKAWVDGLFIGNGKMGASIEGQVTGEHIMLNEETLWYGRANNRVNPDGKDTIPKIRELLLQGKADEASFLSRSGFNSTPKYLSPFVPAADMMIDYLGTKGKEFSNYSRKLDIDEAMVYVQYTINSIDFKREYFVSEDTNTVCIKISASDKFSVESNLNRRPFEEYTGKIDDSTVAIWGQSGADGVKFFGATKISSKDGKTATMGDYAIARDVTEVCFYTTFETDFAGNYNYKNNCIENLNKAVEIGFDKLKEKHIKAYKDLYDRVNLSLAKSDNDMPTDEIIERHKQGIDNSALISENLFAFAKYLTISGSRDCQLPTTLQGIWNGTFLPSWESKYTININTEMNYWPTEAFNLPECHEALFGFVERLAERGTETARELYGCRGSVAHHNTNIWADTAPEGVLDASPVWPMGLAWLSLDFYEHYLHTGDKEFLKNRLIPLFEKSIIFFNDYLYRTDNGLYITGPSLSPENSYYSKIGEIGAICMAPTMDSQILRELLSAYIKACEIIDIKTQYIEIAEDIMAHLPETKLGSDGRIMEWHEEYKEVEMGHRHISHLFGLHPGTQILPENKELFAGAEKSIDTRLANGGGHTGWSCAWMINMGARLKNKEKTSVFINKMINNCIHLNLIDMHPPYQIDGNFGFASGVIECIVQSHNSYIELLPALPEQWSEGSLKGVKLRGNITADISWKDGKLFDYKLSSELKQTVKVKYGDEVKEIAV